MAEMASAIAEVFTTFIHFSWVLIWRWAVRRFDAPSVEPNLAHRTEQTCPERRNRDPDCAVWSSFRDFWTISGKLGHGTPQYAAAQLL
jgi:hypothetical protein